MDDPYATAPLDRDTESHDFQFRLVELQPSLASDRIKCQLRTHVLSQNCPAYIALSYTWGPKERTESIDLNGVSFPVGRNLWSFLEQMRLRGQYGTYWIDAICIDQNNVLERNHQVQMMQRIYSNAQLVAVWLGKDDDAPSIGAAIKYLSTRPRVKHHPGTTCPSIIWTKEQSEGVLALCYRSYWKRVWVIQEVVLAREVKIHCGTESVSWQALSDLILNLDCIHRDGLHRWTETGAEVLGSPATSLVKARDDRRVSGPRPRSLISLLQKHKNQEATNILDKVYALHGLASDSSNLEIDYRISPEDLLMRVLHHIRLNDQTSWVRRPRERVWVMTFGEMMAGILQVDWSKIKVQIERVASSGMLETDGALGKGLNTERVSEVPERNNVPG
jgi:hypothetical protein